MSEDEAKCYILLSKTQGTAGKRINDQEDEVLKDWSVLKKAFVKCLLIKITNFRLRLAHRKALQRRENLRPCLGATRTFRHVAL